MDVCGEACAIRRQELLQLAAQANLNRRWASGEIDWALDISSNFRVRAQAVGLSPALTGTVVMQLGINSAHLRP